MPERRVAHSRQQPVMFSLVAILMGASFLAAVVWAGTALIGPLKVPFLS